MKPPGTRNAEIRIALFRGINVGGSRILPMKELTALLTGLGLSGVSTYIQSGNAVFRAPHGDGKALARRIAAAVRQSRGFAPQVLILTPGELTRIIAANPFPDADAAPNTLHVWFLAEPARKANLAAIAALKADSERFALKDAALYLHAPDGFGRSKLARAAEKHLGVHATARNWRTVLQLRDMVASLA